MSKLLWTNGSRTTVAPKDAKKGWTLEELYKLLDCTMVEVVRVGKVEGIPHILIVDEEGMMKANAQMNVTAFEYAKRPIVGKALLCPTSEFK